MPMLDPPLFGFTKTGNINCLVINPLLRIDRKKGAGSRYIKSAKSRHSNRISFIKS